MNEEKITKENLIPFGDINIFYDNCIFGDVALDVKFKDDFGSTVLFYKALRNYFGKYQGYESKYLINGVFDVRDNTQIGAKEPNLNEMSYWNGQDLILPGNMSVSMLAFSRRFYLSKEDKDYYYFFFRIGDKRYVLDAPYVYTNDLNPDRLYTLGTNRYEFGDKVGGFFTINEKPTKISTMSIIVPKKPCLGELKQDEFSLHLTPINGDESIADTLKEYNEQNPLLCKYKGDKLLSFYDLDIKSNKFVAGNVIDSLNIDFKKKYTKKEILDLGINVLYYRKD